MDTSTLQTYRHMEISSRWTFQHKDFLAWAQFDTRNFWHHGDFGKGYFGRWMFRHLTKQYVHFGTDILAPTFRHLCYCDKMSMCRNVPELKGPWCQKIQGLQEQNMYVSKPGDEMSMPKCLWPKC